jgi:hypothetical protein
MNTIRDIIAGLDAGLKLKCHSASFFTLIDDDDDAAGP